MEGVGAFGGLLCIGGLLFVVIMYLVAAIRIVPEYERGVIFRLGRLVGARGPGLFFVWPPVERMIRVDTRVLTMDIPAQEVIMDYIRATMQIAQTTVRSVLGKVELDTVLADRSQLNAEIQQIIDEQTEPWGVKVTIVEIKDVELPQMMQRAMARQAEAEREKRAKVIHAEGEFQASQQLARAAEIIAAEPVTLQLRYLQTLTEISAEKNSTIIFPLPMDIVSAFLENAAGNGAAYRPRRAPTSAPAPRQQPDEVEQNADEGAQVFQFPAPTDEA
jgi:regulator of protease activity HflC (stomatin/prohibitin superfamily)